MCSPEAAVNQGSVMQQGAVGRCKIMQRGFLLGSVSFREESLGCLNTDEKETVDRKKIFFGIVD